MVAKFKQDGISTEIHNAAAPIVAVPRSLDSVSLPSYYLRNEVKMQSHKVSQHQHRVMVKGRAFIKQ